jgi:hypothetical protein
MIQQSWHAFTDPSPTILDHGAPTLSVSQLARDGPFRSAEAPAVLAFHLAWRNCQVICSGQVLDLLPQVPAKRRMSLRASCNVEAH